MVSILFLPYVIFCSSSNTYSPKYSVALAIAAIAYIFGANILSCFMILRICAREKIIYYQDRYHFLRLGCWWGWMLCIGHIWIYGHKKYLFFCLLYYSSNYRFSWGYRFFPSSPRLAMLNFRVGFWFFHYMVKTMYAETGFFMSFICYYPSCC